MAKTSNSPSRTIPEPVAIRLWGKAAGRCEFDGCNKPLYVSDVSGDEGNFAQKAHIYSFEENGPRGHEPLAENKEDINSPENLLLMCGQCHKNIDTAEFVTKYPASLLQQWKREHEERIHSVTEIKSDQKSHVITYQGNIHGKLPPISITEAKSALFSERHYPHLSPGHIDLAMGWDACEGKSLFWIEEQENLRIRFRRDIVPLIKSDKNLHFSVFSIAPMPLLIELGYLLSDRAPADVYQPIKEPRSWIWPKDQTDFEYIQSKPEQLNGIPVLVLSLSDKIAKHRITEILGENVSIWELTVPEERRNTDHMRSKSQLSIFRSTIRSFLAEIRATHGQSTPLHIFPASPVSCCVELGRVRMHKIDPTWVIYDHIKPQEVFTKTITIGDHHE